MAGVISFHSHNLCSSLSPLLGFPDGLVVKNPPANATDAQETWVQSLGRETLLEEEMATHSSILAWRIPWTEEPGGLQSTGLQEVDTTE